MAVADLVAEWFETDLLQAAVAARAIFGTARARGRRAPARCCCSARRSIRRRRQQRHGQGGPGALVTAHGGGGARGGREIRTGAESRRSLVRDGRAAGVVLADGTEIPARAVVSNADPRRTLLRWSIRSSSTRRSCSGSATTAARHGREGELRAVGAAGVRGRRQSRGRPARPGPHRPGHRLPRARVRRVEVRRDLGRALSRRHDPVARRSVAVPAGPARHVGLRAVRALQARAGMSTGTPSADRSRPPCCARSSATRRDCERSSSIARSSRRSISRQPTA